MDSSVAAEIRQENDASAALDHEHDELWQQLTKYQLACTEDYTGEILYEQNKKQYQANEQRCNSLSSTQRHVKGLLDSSFSIYETVKSGVSVLLDTICYTEAEVDDYSTRVMKAKERKIQTLEEARKIVAQHQSKLEKLNQRCLADKGYQSGLQKLSQILPKLKINEKINFSVVEQDLQAVTQHISEKSSSTDILQRSVRELQSKLDETERYIAEKTNGLESKSEVADKNLKLRTLESQKVELYGKLNERKQCLKLLLCRSIQEKLSASADDVKKYERKLADTQVQTTALRNKQLLQRQNQEQLIRSREITVTSKLSELQHKQALTEEKLQAMMCRLKELKGRLNGSMEMVDWEEQKRNHVLEGQLELQQRLETETVEVTKDNVEMKKNLENSKQSGDAAETILLVERDLMSYLEFYNEQKKQLQEQRVETLTKLKTVQSRIATLKVSNAEKETEHQNLLNDVKNLQGQIEAFTNFHTPAKQAALFEAKSLRTSKSGRRASHRGERGDSDKGSPPSGVPYVEGLQSFSPATLLWKEQARGRSTKSLHQSCNIEKTPNAGGSKSESPNPVTPGAVMASPERDTATKAQVTAQADMPIDENASLFESLLDLSGSEKSFRYESAITKRFPSDIFLEKSPSVGQNESGSSPEVSAMNTLDLDGDKDDADQSVWSVVAAKHVVLDSTLETELDQSVW